MTTSEYNITQQKTFQTNQQRQWLPTLANIINPKICVELAYLAALMIAETFTVLIEPRAGLSMHGVILIALLTHAGLSPRVVQGRFLSCLAIAPLIRLLSLMMPLTDYPTIYWYVLVGVPLLLAVFIASRAVQANRARLGLTAHSLPIQLLVGMTGFGLGYIQYLILRPDPLVEALQLELILFPALILIVFTGFLEELIFRGLMLYTAIRSLGRFGVVYVTLVYTTLHLGYSSIPNLVFIFFTALFFSLVVLRTGSILGVSLSHGITNITLLLVFPFLLANSSRPPDAIQVNRYEQVEQLDGIPHDFDIYQAGFEGLKNRKTIDLLKLLSSFNGLDQESVGLDITRSAIVPEIVAVNQQIRMVSNVEKNPKITGKLSKIVPVAKNKKFRAHQCTEFLRTGDYYQRTSESLESTIKAKAINNGAIAMLKERL